MKNQIVKPGKEKDLRKNATPIAANPSIDKIDLLSSSPSLSSELGVSSKLRDFSSDEL